MRLKRSRNETAISLAEVVVVVAVIAIMATVAVSTINNVVPAARSEIATRNLNFLNGALHSYEQAVGELATNSSLTNIITWLTTRDPDVPGSPYLSTNSNFQIVSDQNTYRARWGGRFFEMTPPGESGTGLNLLQMEGSTN